MNKAKSIRWKEYVLSILLIAIISSICFQFTVIIGYKVVALILMLTVSILASIFDIIPVLIASVLSALIWNYFFIPPVFTFHINTPEDVLMFLMYFVIALINASLTFKIRKAEKKARDKEDKEKTIKLYNTLLNSLSHELRTPISTIIGAIDAIKENNIFLSETQLQDLHNQISVAGLRLNYQVENLLNMSRLDSGMLQLKLDWCDINEIIHTVIEKYFSDENSERIEFHSNEKLPFFKIDLALLEQVLYNIIQNAFQYNAPQTIVTIKVHESGSDLQITIEDNGVGFPADLISKAFDKFYRLPNTIPGGSGIGLSIVKGFVDAHKGTIELSNVIPHGAKFRIEIPCEVNYLNALKHE